MDKKYKWKTLQHNGILFPPKYEPSGFSIKIKGKVVKLDALQEEMAYQWSKKKDTPYAQDAVFQKNFTADFAAALGPGYKGTKYGDIDFTEPNKIVDREKDQREMMTKEQRKEQAAKRKELREELKAKYGMATMDGQPVEVANYMAEPPGIFIGRGAHPFRGKWKRRVGHKDVTLNLGKEAKVPPGDWGKVIHNREATWLASWIDDLTQKTKYVWFADTSLLKQERDRAKYDKAMNLASQIDKIKDRMVKDMKSRDKKTSRIATACYLIYRTAMRVGDEKDEEEADTVGATTLRKEHVRITADAIEFDFLGKDSIRWQETVAATGHDEQFQKNLKELIGNKKASEEIFDGITSRNVNAYYSGIVKGMSAKVFRTYLASREVIRYLREHSNIRGETPNKKLYHAKLANLQAAIMCNHKRTIPKSFEKSLEKKKETLKKAKESQNTPPPKPRTEEEKRRIDKRIKQLKQQIEAAKKSKTADKSLKKKKETLKKITETRDFVPVKERTEKQKQRIDERIERIELQIDLAEKTKDYNIGTSLRNYIDPRVFKSWIDETDAQWEKLYTAALQKKFLWVKNEKGKWETVSKKY